MLRYMTAGESHGMGMVSILDGVPAGLKMDVDFINKELARRMVGYGRGGRMKIEKDKAEVFSGCRKGETLGSPLCLIVHNKDHKIEKLPEIKNPRPGHADLAGMEKFGFSDARNVLERASARETAARVAAGAVAKLILREFGIDILSHVIMIGGIEAETGSLSFSELKDLSEKSDLRCADTKAEDLMRKEIDRAQKEGNTLGGSIEILAEAVPPGLGSYAQWDRRLDGALARAMVSIPAVKAVSIGKGIECASKKGSEVHDPIEYDKASVSFKRPSNNAGGIEGGISNGSRIEITVFMKPIATLSAPLKSVDVDTKEEAVAATERADITAVPACGVVAEAAAAIEIASFFLEKFGGDSLAEIKRNYEGYMNQLRSI